MNWGVRCFLQMQVSTVLLSVASVVLFNNCHYATQSVCDVCFTVQCPTASPIVSESFTLEYSRLSASFVGRFSVIHLVPPKHCSMYDH